MPFKVRLKLLLRGLPKLIAAIVIAGVVGVGLGVGLSALSGNDDSSGGLADTGTKSTQTTRKKHKRSKKTRTATTRTATSTTPAKQRTSTTRTSTAAKTVTATTPAPPPAANAKVRVQIVTAFLQPASTASGRRRKRARISIHVRVINKGKHQIARANPVLLIGAARLHPDPAAKDTTGTLLKSILVGETAGGRLRFETAGAPTTAVTKSLQAHLRIAGRTVVVKLKLGKPPS